MVDFLATLHIVSTRYKKVQQLQIREYKIEGTTHPCAGKGEQNKVNSTESSKKFGRDSCQFLLLREVIAPLTYSVSKLAVITSTTLNT
jgi:hypothetical protein